VIGNPEGHQSVGLLVDPQPRAESWSLNPRAGDIAGP